MSFGYPNVKTVLLICLGLCLSACEDGSQATSKSQPQNQSQSSPPPGLNTAGSFETAKRWLYEKVYAGHELTFYCGCQFDPATRTVDLDSCGVTPRNSLETAQKLDAEHAMAAAWFGQSRLCWREPDQVCPGKDYGGRQCCDKADLAYESAQNDLHNLFPAVAEINRDRKDYNWGMIPGEARVYGKCNIEVASDIRRAEPPDTVKGNIARAAFYMEKMHGLRISDQDRQLYTAWAKTDPPDAWEIERNKRIAEIQGKDNPFITQAASASSSVSTGTSANTDAFSCARKKTCGEMSSCEEARYHLNTCGNTGLDGDGDGVPCASLCAGR